MLYPSHLILKETDLYPFHNGYSKRVYFVLAFQPLQLSNLLALYLIPQQTIRPFLLYPKILF
uniref:Uncharacterized protein n=1 Tax=Arundo donax TaxID=35708 RepID=A0A0A8YIQ2_ARUDO